MSKLKTTVAEIRQGDRFRDQSSRTTIGVGWDATADAKIIDGVVVLPVQYQPDGGYGHREWIDPTIEVEVTRS